MKLALKNLIISEITCQNWKQSQPVTSHISSEKKAIELPPREIKETSYKLQQQ